MAKLHSRPPAGPSGALFIPCVCACVCVCVRYQTPFSSHHESGPSLFLSTGKHPVVGHLPRVFFSALPGQSRDRPNLPPHKKLSIFQFPFASIRRAPSRSMQWTREAKNRSFNVQTGQVRSFRGPPSRPSFSTGPGLGRRPFEKKASFKIRFKQSQKLYNFRVF